MLKSKVRVWLAAIGNLILFLAAAQPGGAHHMVLRFNLEELTVTADRIFVGQCVNIEETHQQMAGGDLAVTRYTFAVDRVVKGKLPGVFTFTQLGHPPHRSLGKGGEVTMHGMSAGPDTFIHGMAQYKVGEKMILFLIPDYMDGKATYPVGLYQGAFSVTALPSGGETVRNGINNTGLFTAPYNGTSMKRVDAKLISPESDHPLLDGGGLPQNVAVMVHKRGALPMDSFLQLVEQINRMHGGEKGILEAAKGAR